MILGSKFGVWSGAYASPLDHVVVMVCVRNWRLPLPYHLPVEKGWGKLGK